MASTSKKKHIARKLSTSRFEAFSDGVFAIAITLLVLDIAIPLNAEDHFLKGLLNQWPMYLAYVVSFATIGAVWFAHSAITDYLEKSDRDLARINLLLLMAVSFLPYPTKLLAEFFNKSGPERVAVTLYGIILLIIASLVSLLWRYALKNKLLYNDVDDDEVVILTERLSPSLYAYIFLIVIGLFLPVVAVIGYLLIALYIILPVRLHKK